MKFKFEKPWADELGPETRRLDKKAEEEAEEAGKSVKPKKVRSLSERIRDAERPNEQFDEEIRDAEQRLEGSLEGLASVRRALAEAKVELMFSLAERTDDERRELEDKVEKAQALYDRSVAECASTKDEVVSQKQTKLSMDSMHSGQSSLTLEDYEKMAQSALREERRGTFEKLFEDEPKLLAEAMLEARVERLPEPAREVFTEEFYKREQIHDAERKEQLKAFAKKASKIAGAIIGGTAGAVGTAAIATPSLLVPFLGAVAFIVAVPGAGFFGGTFGYKIGGRAYERVAGLVSEDAEKLNDLRKKFVTTEKITPELVAEIREQATELQERTSALLEELEQDSENEPGGGEVYAKAA